MWRQGSETEHKWTQRERDENDSMEPHYGIIFHFLRFGIQIRGTSLIANGRALGDIMEISRYHFYEGENGVVTAFHTPQ